MESLKNYFEKGIKLAGGVNKLAAVIRTSGAKISRITMGIGIPGEDVIVRLADYLKEDTGRLLLLRNLEKCPDKSRPYWREVLKRYASVALIVACTIPSYIGFSPSIADASIARDNGRFMHYQTLFRDALKRIRSLIARAFSSEMNLIHA